MSLSDVKVIKANGGLGRRTPTADGVSALLTTGVAVAGKLVLGTSYKIQNAADIEALGINKAYDTANKVLLYYTISEIIRINPNVTLWLMVAPQATVMADLVDPTKTYAAKLLADAEYTIVQIAVSINPAEGYTPDPSGGLDSQVLTAIPKAQQLALYADSVHAPVSAIGLEGKGFNGTITAATNLHTLESNKVSVIIAQDLSSEAAVSHPSHAAIGTWLGCVSKAGVNENIGWPERFPLASKVTGSFLKAGLSGGTAISSYTGEQLDQLDDKGYIFARIIPQLPGVYFNDSHTCTVLTDDYNRAELNRTMDKAIKQIRSVLLPKLQSPLLVDEETGYLQPVTIAVFTTDAENEITNMKRAGEISGGSIYIDPAQNILTSNTLDVDVEIIPTGSAHTIRLRIGFNNPFKQN
ncbi:DUF2586 family protein [Sphingobacterium spiritivorum]|uniref:DUF2586 family protein n=1 Tax=Sphingobacterium spiritivorum TaxID=258 RepID=UPI003DA2A063